MFTRIEATNYRCLKSVAQDLNPFEILVGANASGKSSFLDVVSFLSDLVSEDLNVAVERRTKNFHDLVWGRTGEGFELTLTVKLPAELLIPSATLKYGVEVRLDASNEDLNIQIETVRLKGHDPRTTVQRTGLVRSFWSEVGPESATSRSSRILSALNELPNDDIFPQTARLRESLRNEIRIVALDPKDLARPSPPSRGDPRRISGATLARSVSELRNKHPQVFQDWLAHIRTALPDVRDVESVLREEDKHRYVMIHYEHGVRVPSWTVSEGTLRLLALTILAYLPGFDGVYLIEEPENGVHPTALETIYQSLSSVYDAQVLVATHSPILLNMAKPEQMLCFSKTEEGTTIVRGNEHPALRDWGGEVSLGTIVSSGILG